MFEGLNQSEVGAPFKAYRTDAEGNVTWTDTRWALLISDALYDELQAWAEEQGHLTQFEAVTYEPTPAQIEEFHLPVWGGGDPQPAYLRLPANMTRQQFKRVMRRLLTDEEPAA